MEGAQLPVEPPLVGSFFFLFFVFEKFSLNFFPEIFFFLLSNQRVHYYFLNSLAV